MSAGRCQSGRILHLRLLLCLGAAGCRLAGCGDPLAGDDPSPVHHSPPRIDAKRVPIAPAPRRVISPPPAAEPDRFGELHDRELAFEAEAAPRHGGAPLAVSFSVAIDDPPADLSLQWDFGDGTPAVDGPNATHTYLDPGHYTAALRVAAAGIDRTQTFDIQITEEAFDVDVDAAPDIGRAPLETHFTAVVLDEVAAGLSFAWDFGDGETGKGRTTTHTYREPGQYTASVIATRRNGQRGTADVFIQVDEAGEEPGSSR